MISIKKYLNRTKKGKHGQRDVFFSKLYKTIISTSFGQNIIRFRFIYVLNCEL